MSLHNNKGNHPTRKYNNSTLYELDFGDIQVHKTNDSEQKGIPNFYR
jgi:hypothetical protein